MSREKAGSCPAKTVIVGSSGFSHLFMLSRVQAIEKKDSLEF
jgi:hypothetical protein